MADSESDHLETSSSCTIRRECEERRKLLLQRLRTSIIVICLLVIGVCEVIIWAPVPRDGVKSLSSRKQIESQRTPQAAGLSIGEDGNVNSPISLYLKSWVLHRAEIIWEQGVTEISKFESLPEDDDRWPQLRFGVRSVSAVILGALVAAACSAVGYGGGFLFVMIWRVLLGYDSKTSAALSTFMIMGGSLVGVGMNLVEDNPHHLNKPLVDFEVAVLLQPNVLLGSTIGVILNTIFPDWLLAVLIVPLFVFASVHATRLGLKRWGNESRVINLKRSGKREALRRADTATEKALDESLLGYYKSVSSRYPSKTISILGGVWILVLFLQILRGGHGYKGLLGVKECGVIYWVLTASQVPVAIGVTLWVLYDIYMAARAANTPGIAELQEQGFVAGTKLATFMSGLAFLGGLVAGMFGIGGAVIISPLLLSVGVVPEATAATCQLMVFFAASLSAVQYWVLGHIPIQYALLSALLSAISGAAGVLGLRRIVRKMKRPSIVVFCIAFLMSFSAVVMTVTGSQEVWNDLKAGAYMGFNSPC